MPQPGYYRHPTIHGGTVVFVFEDDLWSTSVSGGMAVRLTANPGSHSGPRFSPDGSRLAFTSRDEGRLEVHVMDSGGGPSRRLTYFAASTRVVGWNREAVVAATDFRQPFAGWTHLWEIPLEGAARPLNLGPAGAYAGGGPYRVLARNGFDPSRWKRYRGGLSGTLWIDRGDGFEPLVKIDANLSSPMWVGNRLFFLSDHEGVGNIYSVTAAGRGLKRHTDHDDFYVRFPSTDGSRIVYHSGGDLYVLDPKTGSSKIEIVMPSSRPHRNRRFVPVSTHLESFDLHPQGHSLVLSSRGATFTMALWEGAARRHDPGSRVRERLATYTSDGNRLVAISDETGDERLIVRHLETGEVKTFKTEVGRPRSIDVSAHGLAAITNHRHQLLVVDLEKGNSRRIHHSPFSWIGGVAWSPDGRWLAYSAAVTRTTMNLFLYDTESKKAHQIGRPEFVDHSPVFDPGGKYLFFLGGRVFEPVADAVFHDYGFPRATVPMAIPLTGDTPSPFDVTARTPRAPGSTPEAPAETPTIIDLDGIGDRVVAFPLGAGIYTRIEAATGRVLVLHRPPASPLAGDPPKPVLQAWDLALDKMETVCEGVDGFGLSSDRKVMILKLGEKLRVVPAGWKDDKNGNDKPGRETGFLDLDRIGLEVDPGEEWAQMFDEAWRLQRDQFWTEDMSGVSWGEVRRRYGALVERVATRSEFSDLLWEMQGELGTSHAYELGGEYRPEPAWSQGLLGADIEWRRRAWRVVGVPEGDSWAAPSPLRAPGIDVEVGDRIVSVDGKPLSEAKSPESRLVHRADRPVRIGVARGRAKTRQVVVKPVTSEFPLRYRDWVSSNRNQVKQASGGRLGYIHIPDMQAVGFAEFNRGFRAEVDCQGLVIDVRFNRGGNVSQLLLEKLVRRRLGFRVTRWRALTPFPYDSPAGPMVCLTNEMAGSDGDIFSHTFKRLGLGPLIGTRTWGGVIGIWPQHSLVDGTVTTQPEYATWFDDVGYAIENLGAEPDIEVVITPDDYAAGRDPQLERAIAELLPVIEAIASVDLGPRPRTGFPGGVVS